MKMKKRIIGALCLALMSPVWAESGEEHEEGGAIVLSVDERSAAGVDTALVDRRSLSEAVRVPGEVVINAYQSSRVTPRIAALVEKRHVRLGDAVEAGQALVTLSSVAMAEAQGEMIVSDREWQRVKSLGRKTVSARRYTEAQVARQQALAKVKAYGMSESQALKLLETGDASRATGAFDLVAPQAGTVLQDDFIVGELIEPGRVLIDITDEAVMWVEAKAVGNSLPNVDSGAPARVSLDGGTWIEGKVVQRHHRLDETTRTQGLRIEVNNTDDTLHPGQFVEAEIVTGKGDPVLAIPSSAVTLLDGRATVFKLEEGDEFHAEAIELGATVGDWVVVRGGLTVGDEIAVDGVFYLKSMQLKSSLGEGHAH